jgi:outer membrane protein OmpA-like peptidoglycan-associated protein
MLMNKYLPGDKSENGISLSYRTATGWSFPEALEIKDFYNKSKTGEYCLSANTQSILMAVERNDAIGDKDIYVSHKTADGKWSAPINLGETINTAESETSPFLAPDGKTLYFATSGFPGYGSMDMFVSRRLDDSWTNWSRPQNLGPKLNSTGFDAYYSIPASGDYAYFSSNKNSKASSDIFRVKLPQSAKPQAVVLIKGKVVNAKTKEPIAAAIKFESLTDSTKIGFARSNPTNGEYSIVLPAGTVYGFLAVKDGFLSVGENLNLEKTSEYKELTINLNLTAIETGAFITLNNLFFDFSRFDIETENLPELKRLLSLLNLYPNMEIEISGHTDNIGTDQANLLLSSNRAKAVADYLFSKGISKNRIKSVGKGKTMPAADNSTEDGRALNRRIEMKIIKVE